MTHRLDLPRPTALRIPAAAATLRVSLRHACPIVRAGLAAVLAGQPGLCLSEDEHGNGHGHGNELRRFGEVHVVVADYATGVQLARLGAAQPPGRAPRVLILTERHKEWEVRHAVDCGVHGYLLQGCSTAELVKGVHQLGRGIAYLSEAATRCVLESLGRPALTRRETDVLRVLARGGSDKLIARELGIGAGTVKSHIKHLLQKLDASARTQAVVVAIERGLLGEREADAVARPVLATLRQGPQPFLRAGVAPPRGPLLAERSMLP